MKVTKISATMIDYREVSMKYPEETAVALVRLKKHSQEKFCQLRKIYRSVC